MDKAFRRKHQSHLRERIKFGSMENKENIRDSASPSSWDRYGSLRMEFAHLSSELSGSRQSSVGEKMVPAEDSVSGGGLELKQWSSFVGLDMVMLDIQDQMGNLVSKIDHSIYGLVQKTKDEFRSKSRDKITTHDIENLRETAKKNWDWLRKMSETVTTHLSNATEYHLFHQSLMEHQIAIPQIGVTERKRMIKDSYEGNYEEANLMYKTMKDHLIKFLRWWQKIEATIVQSRKIKPLGLRTNNFDFKRPSTLLMSSQPKMREGQKLFVSKRPGVHSQYWTVQPISGGDGPSGRCEGEEEEDTPVLPATVELCAPDVHSIERALLLRLDLLASWTTAIREVGGALMAYIATVLAYWSHVDISACTGTQTAASSGGGGKSQGRRAISRTLDSMQALLDTYWSSSPQLLSLQSHISQLKNELDIRAASMVVNGDQRDHSQAAFVEEEEDEEDEQPLDDETQISRNTIFLDISPKALDEIRVDESSSASLSRSETYVLQKRAITVLVNKYRDLHKYWDEYRRLVEHSSELALLSEIHSANENISDNSPTISDQLLSFLSADDQHGWSKYLELLSDKFGPVLSSEAELTSTTKRSESALINVLPRNLELLSRTDTRDFRSGRQQTRLDIAVPAEKEMHFFGSSSSNNTSTAMNRPHVSLRSNTTQTQHLSPRSPRGVDISHYFTNSLLPSANKVKRHSSDVSSYIGSAVDETETVVSLSRFSTLTDSVNQNSTLNSVNSLSPRRDYTKPPQFLGLPRHPTASSYTNSVTRKQRPKSSTLTTISVTSASTASTIPPSPATPMMLLSPPVSLSKSRSRTLNMVPMPSSSLSSDLETVQRMRHPELRIQSYFLVASVPRVDRVRHVLDRRQGTLVSVRQARQLGLVDEQFLQLRDSATNAMLPFGAAVTQGLVVMAAGPEAFEADRGTASKTPSSPPPRVGSSDFYEKKVFKVDAVYDLGVREWVSLKEAVRRNVVNGQSGLMRVEESCVATRGAGGGFCHIVAAMRQAPELLCAKQLYHCNIRSLPPEMTVELPRV